MTPEAPRRYDGIQNYDVSTASFLFRPEDAFALTNQLNIHLPKEEWVGIEVYPTLKRLSVLHAVSKRYGFVLPTPGGIDADDIERFLEKYPNTKVERVHLPFSYNFRELMSMLTSKPQEHEFLSRAHHLVWMVYLGRAVNKKGIALADDLGVGVTAHANVVNGFRAQGKLHELKQSGIPYILSETGQPYTMKYLRDSRMSASPSFAIENVVQPAGIDGILMGVDHGLEKGVDLGSELDSKSVQDNVWAMHLSGSRHGLIAAGDRRLASFLQKTAQTSFAHPVRGVIELNPNLIKRFSRDEQLEVFRNAIAFVRNIQATQSD